MVQGEKGEILITSIKGQQYYVFFVDPAGFDSWNSHYYIEIGNQPDRSIDPNARMNLIKRGWVKRKIKWKGSWFYLIINIFFLLLCFVCFNWIPPLFLPLFSPPCSWNVKSFPTTDTARSSIIFLHMIILLFGNVTLETSCMRCSSQITLAVQQVLLTQKRNGWS